MTTSNRKKKDNENVFIRTDASLQTGTGHVMRCLTLAQELQDKGAVVSFICRNLPGNLCDLIKAKGYVVHGLDKINLSKSMIHTTYNKWLDVPCQVDILQTKEILSRSKSVPDWLIVDHYGIDRFWERQIRPFVKQIMVIDDLANRPHDCDLLLDPNWYENLEVRYNGLVPVTCRKLLGPSHSLLRSEFKEAKKNLRKRDGRIKRILIFFGGTDPTNETAKSLEAIKELNKPEIIVDIVVGQANPNRKQIENLCKKQPNINYFCQIDNMAEMMANADLAIGAGGTTIMERIYLDLPTITVATAANQVEALTGLSKRGYLVYLGKSQEVSVFQWAKAIINAVTNGLEVKKHEFKFNKHSNFFWEQL